MYNSLNVWPPLPEDNKPSQAVVFGGSGSYQWTYEYQPIKYEAIDPYKIFLDNQYLQGNKPFWSKPDMNCDKSGIFCISNQELCNTCGCYYTEHTDGILGPCLNCGEEKCSSFGVDNSLVPPPNMFWPIGDLLPYYHELCKCGHELHKHWANKYHNCGSCYSCKSFDPINKEKFLSIKKQLYCNLDSPPEEVLKLVKGSTKGDWSKHTNGGGWVYKTAKVSSDALVTDSAVVYDKAIIGPGAAVMGYAKVFGAAHVNKGAMVFEKAKVGEEAVIGQICSVHGSAKVYGTVEAGAQVYGRAFIKGGMIVPKNKKVDTTPKQCRTQKAKGIEALKNHGFDVPKDDLKQIEKLKTEKQIATLVGSFVRPCPVTPRHGFVDSRAVNSLEDAKQLIKETKAADPQAEFIIMPFIKATHSGVWTEGQLSVGPGNDGATSGKNSYTVPAQGTPNIKNANWQALLKEANITQAPYIELLWTNHESAGSYGPESDYKIQFVQLRDGPKLPDAIDYIPSEMKVQHVVKADGDLLEWETRVKEFKPGTVVYHPGGSLASHYSVHAFLSKIPVLISREPKVGETLVANTTTQEPDISLLRRGFMLGCMTTMGYKQACYIMMAGCHSTTKWAGRQDLLLGLAMGCCYRLLMTVSLGEYRHKKRFAGQGDAGRNAIYQKIWDVCLDSDSKKKFIEATTSFDKDDCWSSSYGGVNWYVLSRWAMLIMNSLSKGDVKASLENFNKGVNSVHNGGWTFNKFMSKNEMDTTANNPLYSIIRVAPLLYNALSSTESNIFKPSEYEITHKSLEQYMANRNKTKGYASKPINKKCCKADCCGDPECLDCHPIVIEEKPKIVVKKKVDPNVIPDCPTCKDSKEVEVSEYPEHGTHFCTKHEVWIGEKQSKAAETV